MAGGAGVAPAECDDQSARGVWRKKALRNINLLYAMNLFMAMACSVSLGPVFEKYVYDLSLAQRGGAGGNKEAVGAQDAAAEALQLPVSVLNRSVSISWSRVVDG